MSSRCGNCRLKVCRCKVSVTYDSCKSCGNVPDYCCCQENYTHPSPLPVYVSAAQSTDVALVATVPTTLMFNDVRSLSRQMCDTQYGMWMAKSSFANGIFTIPMCASGFYSLATNVSVTNAGPDPAVVTTQLMIDNTPVYSATKTVAAGASDAFHLGGGIALMQGQKIYVVVTSTVAGVTVNKLGSDFSAFFTYYSKC